MANEHKSSEGKKDELKGRGKKAVGEATDDKELKREGEIDKATGKVKEGVDKAARKAKGGE